MEPEEWEELQAKLQPLWTLILSAIIVTCTVKATLWVLAEFARQLKL